MKKLLLLTVMVFFGFTTFAQETLYEQNFDNLTVGEGIAQQLDEWDTWSHNPGSSEDGVISDEQAVSGSQSLLITGTNDNIYNLGDKTSGKYAVNFKYFVAPNCGGYYNIQHIFGSKWAFEIYFKNDGSGVLKANGESINFNFTNGEWLDIENIIDISENLATLKINGAEIHSWPYNTEAGGAVVPTPTLGVFNFFAGVLSGQTYTPKYFVDDFEYIMIDGGLLPPTIETDLSSIEVTDNDNLILTINNVGEQVLTYYAYPVYPQEGDKASNDDETTTIVLRPGTKSNELNELTMQKASKPFMPTIDKDATLTHVQSAFGGGFGYGSVTNAKVAALFRPGDLKNYIGMKLKEVRVALHHMPGANTTNLNIWERGGFITPGPGALMFTKPFTPVEQTEVTIPITKDIFIDGKDLWIGYTAKDLGEGNFPFGIDEGPQVPNANYVSHGPGWSTINEDFGNLFIIAELTGEAMPNYMTVTPESGEIEGGANAQVMLNFSTSGLPVGTYEAELHIASNDKNNEYFVIPVHYEVTIGTDDLEHIGIMTYPNPTQDIINVQANQAIKTVQVINQVGQVVYTKAVNGLNKHAINISDLEKGVYMIQIELTNNKTVTNKFVIK